MNSSSNSADPFNDDELEFVKSQRDSFHSLREEIQKDIIEKKSFAIQRFANWRLNLANISFALAAAILPLLFFTGKEPRYKMTFYAGVLLLLINGIVAYAKEKKDIETDINALGYLGSEEEYKTTVYINILNKALFYNSKEVYLEYFNKSNKDAQSATKRIVDDANQTKSRVSIWNEIHVLIIVFASFFMAREVISIETTPYWILFVLLLATSILYTYVGFKKADVETKKSIEWKKKIATERKQFNDWWKDRLN